MRSQTREARHSSSDGYPQLRIEPKSTFFLLLIEFPQMSPDNQVPDKGHFGLGQGQGGVHPLQCIIGIVDENISPLGHANQLFGLSRDIRIHMMDSVGVG
jgi:hypothetical protein